MRRCRGSSSAHLRRAGSARWGKGGGRREGRRPQLAYSVPGACLVSKLLPLWVVRGVATPIRYNTPSPSPNPPQGAIGKHDRVHGSPNHARGLSCDRAPWQNDTVSDGTSLHMVIRSFRPSCLLGLAGQPSGIFREDLIREIAEMHPAPILLPLSNPTTKAECTPAQAYEWSGGRAIVATGSPFGKVTLADGTTRIPSQCNNM